MFTIVSAIAFTWLALIWSKKSNLNMVFKLVFLGLGIWGFVEYF